jgi:hypothetical protein
MAITVKHSKVSTIPDDADTSLVRPSDWNDDHVLTGTVPVANGGTGASTASDGLNALLPSQTGNNGKVLSTDGTNATWSTNGSGDVVGPASSTDNAVARFDSTTGKLLQNSVVTIGDTGATTGVTTFSASTSVTTPIVQATNSGGLALKNSAGTTQMSVGAGGGDNMSINVSTNLNGTNAQIDISPTGTGHVHIKPTGVNSVEIIPVSVGKIDNVVIGATTAVAGSFTDLSVTGTTSFDGSQGTVGQVLTSAGTGATPTWTTPTVGDVVGPASATDNAVARFDSTTGKLIQNSTVTIDDSGQLNLTNASNYNLYASGAGANYMAGSLGIGSTSLTDRNLAIGKTITGATAAYGIVNNGVIQSDVTSLTQYYRTTAATAAAAFTLSELYHFSGNQGTIGATSVVTTQGGFHAANSLTGATNNYAFSGNIASGTGRFNLYMVGTANNYLAGSLGIGSTSLTDRNLALGKNITGGTIAYAMLQNGTIQSDVTNTAYGFRNFTQTVASAFTLSISVGYQAVQGTIGATSAITTQQGFLADSTLIGATNNYGFYGNIAAATGRYNLYMSGTAANYFGGDMQFNKTVTAAGTTGAQTISKNAGTVNFAAAATSLVVTNTLVTANSIIICTVGTNDTTMKSVSAVAAAGSFTIFSNAAATAETRVNFIVIN